MLTILLGCTYSSLRGIDAVLSSAMTGTGLSEVNGEMNNEMQYTDEPYILDPLNSKGVLRMDTKIPVEVSGIEDVTNIYTVEGNPEDEKTKIIQPKLLEHAERAMTYVKRVYNLIEKYNHMYAGKSQELGSILESYTAMLTAMLEDTLRLKHLSFIRRYLTHVSKGKQTLLEAEARRATLVTEASNLYRDICEKHETIKLDFERHYAHPSLVINSAVSSLVGIGEAYKRLVTLHQEVYHATDAIRLGLNGIRASSVYMFSYMLCLDILFTEILPLRTVAVQDIVGTTGTGDVLAAYHDKIGNRRTAIKALLKDAQLNDSNRRRMESIYQEVVRLYARGKTIRRSTVNFVSKSKKEAVLRLKRRISSVVDVWNKQYRRPLVMSAKLIEEYRKLNLMTHRIETGQGIVHRNKQALYTMAAHAEDLYQEARALANLSRDSPIEYDGIRSPITGSRMDTTSDAPASRMTNVVVQRAVLDGTSSSYKSSRDLGSEHLSSRDIGTTSIGDPFYMHDLDDDTLDDYDIPTLSDKKADETASSVSATRRSEYDTHTGIGTQQGLTLQDIDNEWNRRLIGNSDISPSPDSDGSIYKHTESRQSSDKPENEPTIEPHSNAAGGSDSLQDASSAITDKSTGAILSDAGGASHVYIGSNSSTYKTGIEPADYGSSVGLDVDLETKKLKIDKRDDQILDVLVELLMDIRQVNDNLIIYKDDIMEFQSQPGDAEAVRVSRQIILELHRICMIYSNTTESSIPQQDDGESGAHPPPS